MPTAPAIRRAKEVAALGLSWRVREPHSLDGEGPAFLSGAGSMKCW